MPLPFLTDGAYAALCLYENEFSIINITGDSFNIYLENITVYSCGGSAVKLTNCKNIYINRFNVKLLENSSRLLSVTGSALYSQNAENVKFTNSLIENCACDAVSLSGSKNLEIYNCVLRNNFGNGIFGDCEGFEIRNCLFANNLNAAAFVNGNKTDGNNCLLVNNNIGGGND